MARQLPFLSGLKPRPDFWLVALSEDVPAADSGLPESCFAVIAVPSPLGGYCGLPLSSQSTSTGPLACPSRSIIHPLYCD